MTPLPLPSRLLFALMWLAGSLPLPAIRVAGRMLSWLPRLLHTREARLVRDNIARCFPELDAAQRRRLGRQALAETARMLLETFRLWTRPPAVALGWIRGVDGEALLAEAEAAGRGVIVAAPHLGNWELLNRWLATRGRLAIVYRSPKLAALEPLLVRGRGDADVVQLRAEPGSVRGMLRHLRAGGTLGLLPDQRPKAGEGEWVPFFGHPARTMTLLPKLATSSGCAVVFGFAERCADGSGFVIRLRPAPAALFDADPRVAATALNAAIEACAREAPAQYQWTYRRFPRRGHDAGDAASSPPPTRSGPGR
jgi:Kdo2-lipid IVA lauroyltransferase/acyltransferase